MKEFFCCIFSIIFVTSTFWPGIWTETTLKILMTTHMTGKGDSQGMPCVKAAEIAVEAANKDPTFLPGYHVQMHVEDDGYPSFAPRALISYYRQYLEMFPKINDTIGVPIAVGILHSQGVARTASVIPYLDVNLISAGGILAPMFVFPHLFKTRAESMPHVDAIVGFMEHFNWKRLAILSAADSPIGLKFSQIMMAKLESKNLTLTWFEGVQNFNHDFAQSLLKSDSRIIFLANMEKPVISQFLCQMFSHGITGPTFQFIAFNVAVIWDSNDVPNTVIPGCSADNLLVQYRQTIFIGSKPLPSDMTAGISRFGYNYEYFIKKFYEKIKGIQPDDFQDICFCHDGMLHALLSLEQAENELAKANLTVKNIYDNRATVFGKVTEALKKTRYNGIRNPTTSFDPMKVNNEPIMFQHLTQENKWIFPYQYQNGQVEKLMEFSWNSQDGKPPRDQPLKLEIMFQLPEIVFIVVSVVQGLLGIIQLMTIALLWWKQSGDKHNTSISSVVGCAILNIAVTMSMARSEHVTKAVACGVEIALLVIGMAILNRGLMLNSLHGWLQYVTNPKVESSANNQHTTFHSRTISQGSRFRSDALAAKQRIARSKMFAVFGFIFLFVNFTILICWFAMDGISSNNEIVSNIYDGTKDQYTLTSVEQCSSNRLATFSVVFTLLNLVPMVAVAMVASIKRFMLWDIRYRMSALALLNTVFMVFICIVAVISNKIVFGREIVTVAGGLVISTTCTIAMAFTIKEHDEDHENQMRNRLNTLNTNHTNDQTVSYNFNFK